MPTAQSRETGEVYLGRYEAMELLGEGGMGRVYLGRQLDNGRQVAIKVMHEEIAAQPHFRQRFDREMQLMAGFSHPHAVALLDASLDDPQTPCIVMEYVPGISLDEILGKDGALTPERAGRLLGQLCWVLQAAHGAGILHRDLSCANLMVVDPGTSSEQLKVMDFGLAQLGAGPYIPLEKLTGSGNSIGGGTPDYMCPEQIRGDAVDHRADLYSVGVVLFKMLTGRLPFGEFSVTADILLAHAEQPPPPFSAMNDRALPAVEAVVRSCLAKFPCERPQSARELAERFQGALGQKIIEWEAAEESPPAASALRETRIDLADVLDQMEAWMPERIAVVKLRGFVHDMGGEIIESVPGLIRVKLPGPPRATEPASGGFWSFLGFGRQISPPSHVILELHMEKRQAKQNQLQVTVVMNSDQDDKNSEEAERRSFCEQLCQSLRGYLISSR